MSNKEFRLPDVGEGLTEADIVSWHVHPGDTVTVNQVIVEIETAKAVVELPSPYAGTVSALLVEVGQTVDVGTPIIAVDVPGTDGAEAGPAAEPASQPASAAKPDSARQPVLVGYGVKPGTTSRRPRKKPPTRPGSYPATPSGPPTGGPDGGAAGGPQFPAGLQLPPASRSRRRRRPGSRARRADQCRGPVPWRSPRCGGWPGTSASTLAGCREAGRKARSPGRMSSARPVEPAPVHLPLLRCLRGSGRCPGRACAPG